MVCEHVALASEPFKDRKYFKMFMAFSACRVIG